MRVAKKIISLIVAFVLILSIINIPTVRLDANAEGSEIIWDKNYHFNEGQIIPKGTVIKNRWEAGIKPAGLDYWTTYFNTLSIGYVGLQHRDELYGTISREMERTGYEYNDEGLKTGEKWEQISEVTYEIPFDSVVVEYEEPTTVLGSWSGSGYTAGGLWLMPKSQLALYAYYLEHNLDINGYAGIDMNSGEVDSFSVEQLNDITKKDYDNYYIDVIYVGSECYDQAIQFQKEGVFCV